MEVVRNVSKLLPDCTEPHPRSQFVLVVTAVGTSSASLFKVAISLTKIQTRHLFNKQTMATLGGSGVDIVGQLFIACSILLLPPEGFNV
jgi:hypothetical protein